MESAILLKDYNCSEYLSKEIDIIEKSITNIIGPNLDYTVEIVDNCEGWFKGEENDILIIVNFNFSLLKYEKDFKKLLNFNEIWRGGESLTFILKGLI